jgi:hypothetical protein
VTCGGLRVPCVGRSVSLVKAHSRDESLGEAIDMKRNAVMYLATVVCICTAAASAHAHHSHGMFYDLCTSVTIEGKVESVQWKNPHTWIDLKTNDGAAYRAEWTSLRGLTNSGVAGPAQEALRVGERVVVTGNPMRDPALIRASYPAFNEPAQKMVDLTQIRRASDSWSWTRAPEPTPPRCAQK